MIGKIITAAAMNDCLKSLRVEGSVDFWRQLDNLDLVGFPWFFNERHLHVSPLLTKQENITSLLCCELKPAVNKSQSIFNNRHKSIHWQSPSVSFFFVFLPWHKSWFLLPLFLFIKNFSIFFFVCGCVLFS